MFLGWFVARRIQGANTRLLIVDQSVGDAEEIVRRAWRLELLQQQDHLQFARHAAERDCDLAHELLAAAQRDGDAHGIADAHSILERAQDAARRSALACERTLETLREELDLLAKAGKVRSATVATCPPERHASMPTAQPPSSIRSVLTRGFRRVLAVLPSERGVFRWLRRIVVRRAAALGQP